VDGDDAAGGSLALASLIDDYGSVIAADLAEVYGVDLRDLYRDETSPRWWINLIIQLPAGSRFYAEKRGGPAFRGWDEDRYAMVAVINAVRALQWTYVASKSKRRPPQLQPFPIPDEMRRRKEGPGTFAFIAKKKLAELKQKENPGG
jgi:hypothetical protein